MEHVPGATVPNSARQPKGLSDAAVQNDPFAYYAERRSACPVWRESDIDLYVVGGMVEARAALNDPGTFSSAPTRRGPGANAVAVAYMEALAERGWARAVTLQRTDPPVHTTYRKVLNRVFTPARVRALTPGIESIVNELLDGFLNRGRCEFVADFALPLPGMFIAEQLGLDRSQYRTFRRWAEAMLSLAQRPNMTLDEAMAEVEIELEAQHYLAAECEKRRDRPVEMHRLIVAARQRVAGRGARRLSAAGRGATTARRGRTRPGRAERARPQATRRRA